MNRFAAGAVGGLLATVPMTVVMTTLFPKLQPRQQYPLPPREITEVFVARVSGDRHLDGRGSNFWEGRGGDCEVTHNDGA